MEKALKELDRIIDLNTGPKRKMALDAWKETWVRKITASQLVLDKKYLTSENSDFLKYNLSTKMVENMMTECINITTKDCEMSAEVCLIRRSLPND